MADKIKTYKNFGQIKSIYNEILAESISTGNKNKKNIVKHYIKSLKESEILRTQFYIFNNIENKIETDKNKAIEFVKENISLMDKFSKKQIKEVMNSILNPIVKNYKYDNVDVSGDKLRELYENISILINTKKTAKTVGNIVEVTHKVSEYILNNNEANVDNNSIEGLGDTVFSNKDLSKLMINKFNKEYSSSLSESDINLINLIVESNEEEKENLFKNSISECLSLINSKLESADVDLKMSLLNLKENLLDKKYNNKSFEFDVLKLKELKNNFK